MFSGEDLSASVVREALIYDPETGLFTWRYRPEREGRWNTRFAGKPAGSTKAEGRVVIRLDFHQYFAHRLAWLMYFGRWPSLFLDHRNGNATDNRIADLRECTQAENHQNRKPHGHGTGTLGVARTKQKNRWKSQITRGSKYYHLGTFPSPQEAAEAYLRAKKILHRFQPEPRDGSN